MGAASDCSKAPSTKRQGCDYDWRFMSQVPGATSEQPTLAPARYSFANPYVQLTLSILQSAAAQLLLKQGAGTGGGGDESWFGFSSLHSGWVWLGIGALIGSLLSWLQALRYVPLSLAFTLA